MRAWGTNSSQMNNHGRKINLATTTMSDQESTRLEKLMMKWRLGTLKNWTEMDLLGQLMEKKFVNTGRCFRGNDG